MPHSSDGGSEALTAREREVLALVGEGLTNREIGKRLGIKENAVRFHLKQLHAKLATDSDRAVLARTGGHGWRALGLIFARFGVAASVGVFGVALGGLAFGAYLAYPEKAADSTNPPPLIDGRYPNGCSAEYNAGTMTLGDFATGPHASIDELRALNPGLGDGPLAPETLVRVPYDPMKQCMVLEPTPPGSQPPRGGTPASMR